MKTVLILSLCSMLTGCYAGAMGNGFARGLESAGYPSPIYVPSYQSQPIGFIHCSSRNYGSSTSMNCY